MSESLLGNISGEFKDSIPTMEMMEEEMEEDMIDNVADEDDSTLESPSLQGFKSGWGSSFNN